jgi:Zn-dependent protease with chaperone function
MAHAEQQQASAIGDGLFKIIQTRQTEDGESMPFFSTHPLDATRIRTLDRMAEQNGWPRELPTTPLPEEFGVWIGTGAG